MDKLIVMFNTDYQVVDSIVYIVRKEYETTRLVLYDGYETTTQTIFIIHVS